MQMLRSIVVVLVLLVAAACTGTGDGATEATATSAPAATTTTAPARPGHPAAGLHLVAAPPADFADDVADFGFNVAVTATRGGDPLVVYEVHDPNHDGFDPDSVLYAARWDAGTGHFAAPVAIGITVSNASDGQAAVAADPVSGDIALAYLGPDSSLLYTTSSDDGATWSEPVKVHDAADAPRLPAVAIVGGAGTIVFVDDTGVVRAATIAFGTVAETTPPVAPALLLPVAPAVAASAGGTVGVAYARRDDADAATVTVEYWRPDKGTVVRAVDSGGVADDDVSLGLAFAADDPVLGVSMARRGDDARSAYAVASRDGGTSFSAPVKLPSDGGDAVGAFTRVAANAQHHAAIGYTSGARGGGAACGQPKVVASSGDLESWTTCSPDEHDTQAIAAGAPALAAGVDDSLYVAFANFHAPGAAATDALGPGVWLWVG